MDASPRNRLLAALPDKPTSPPPSRGLVRRVTAVLTGSRKTGKDSPRVVAVDRDFASKVTPRRRSGNRISGIVRSAKTTEDKALADKIRQELAEFDHDGDGTIDNEELVKFIKKHADNEKKLAEERHAAELDAAQKKHDAEVELNRREKAERNVVRVFRTSA